MDGQLSVDGWCQWKDHFYMMIPLSQWMDGLLSVDGWCQWKDHFLIYVIIPLSQWKDHKNVQTLIPLTQWNQRRPFDISCSMINYQNVD